MCAVFGVFTTLSTESLMLTLVLVNKWRDPNGLDRKILESLWVRFSVKGIYPSLQSSI